MKAIEKNKIERLKELHLEIIGAMKMTVDKAIEAGGILEEIKESLPHGRYLGWIEENTGINIRTAQRYVKCFKNKEQIKSDSVSYLTEAYKAIEEPKIKTIHDLKEAKKQFIDQCVDTGDMNSFLMLIKNDIASTEKLIQGISKEWPQETQEQIDLKLNWLSELSEMAKRSATEFSILHLRNTGRLNEK